jgi:hypothetical protein
MWSRPGGAPVSDFEPQFEHGPERAILELARPGGGSARLGGAASSMSSSGPWEGSPPSSTSPARPFSMLETRDAPTTLKREYPAAVPPSASSSTVAQLLAAAHALGHEEPSPAVTLTPEEVRERVTRATDLITRFFTVLIRNKAVDSNRSHSLMCVCPSQLVTIGPARLTPIRRACLCCRSVFEAFGQVFGGDPSRGLGRTLMALIQEERLQVGSGGEATAVPDWLRNMDDEVGGTLGEAGTTPERLSSP